MKNTHRYIAKIIFETTSALAVGSGQSDLNTARLIARDFNDLPYVPGTSLAGVVRHAYEAANGDTVKDLFGFQDLKEKEGTGSRIIFSSAHLVATDGTTILDGLQDLDFSQDSFYKNFSKSSLPIRDHVKITEKGVAKDQGKFDEQLVYKGTRFGFEIELVGTADDMDNWSELLAILSQPNFRLGAGTRNGFGAIKIVDIQARTYVLTNTTDLMAYLGKTSSLNDDCIGFASMTLAEKVDTNWKAYSVTLKPENFFLFGAGVGDLDVDLRPKTEKVISWASGQAQFSEEQILIPATSVKGAIAHRLAFHYNKLCPPTLSTEDAAFPDTSFVQTELETHDFGINLAELKDKASTDEAWEQAKKQIEEMTFGDFSVQNASWKAFSTQVDKLKKAEKDNPIKRPVGEDNPAVKALFGYAKQEEDSENKGQIGHVIISDVHMQKKAEKIFSHVAIDRFTAGGIDGALFQEKVATVDEFELEILVHEKAFPEENPNVKVAWKNTMEDLKKGWIPLGGNTTKGHGIFRAN